MKKLIIIEVVFGVLIVVGFAVWKFTRTTETFSWQSIVDGVVSIHHRTSEAELLDLMKYGMSSNTFDVNLYFEVLDKLKPEDGYMLNWVYWLREGRGGRPVLYARKTTDPKCVSLGDYVAFSTNASFGKVGRELHANEAFFLAYLDKIHVQDSPEGFFQFVVLRLLGDKFHLFWHELYNDIAIVCSQEAWHELLKQEGKRFNPLPEDFKPQAEKIDFTPRLKIGKRKVELNVYTFCQFGGIKLHYFVVSREFPHRILKHTQKTLLNHNPGFVY